MNEKAMRKSKSLKGKDKTEQEALRLPNGKRRGANKEPRTPIKVKVVGSLAQRREGGGGKQRHVERNKILAATMRKRKETVRSRAGRLALTAGDIQVSERQIEKRRLIK